LSLIAELKRRNVFKACAAYLALGWVVIQVTATMAPALNLPPSVVPIVTWIGVAGFPFIVLFAWIFEITPEGLKRESEVDRSTSITRVTGRRLDYAIIALLLLAIGLVAFDRFAPRRGPATPAASAAPQAPQPVAAPLPSDNSIAVLPFVNMSDDKGNEYFSDGLSEELLNLLAQIPQLRVIARTSSFSFKGKEVDVATIAKTLAVAHVLEGSVRKSGDKLRITAQLIRAGDSSHLWSETYDRELTDVFKVQDEIAGAVVAQLRIKLLPAQQVTNPHRTAVPEAYNQYLLGNQFFVRDSPDDFRRAVKAYEQAVALDPDYAAAHAGRAMAEIYAGEYAETASENVASKQRAAAAADKAIALQPTLADGYAARGFIRSNLIGDWDGALADMRKAVALEPGNSTAQRRYGQVLQGLGRLPEAIAATRKAIDLDPLSSSAWNVLAGSYLGDRGQFAQARAAVNRALSINPESQFALSSLVVLDLLEGNAAEALAAAQRCGEVWKDFGVALAEHTLGHEQESQRALDALIAKYAHDSAYQIAEIYAWRGDADKAFEWLDRAHDQHDGGLGLLKTDLLFEPLRSDPRFAALLKRLKLPA
jgi:serine/threonine-protein kinase